ncbi:histidine kinase [Mucilaginibacter rigui]|uniref:Histidine kinase n=1 Tax=Mucilaginibacter rigui TaxID=534635 RepID=A0ABR7X976_9SPHI|nr:histidine kinase [Mucilaginibacter rigui]MBD1386690.1 histidine kinase [Mucilaginibacter rigui]
MDKNEQRICGYSSLLIALMVNSARLLALRPDGIMAHYWQFDLGELIFQFFFNLAFCGLLFYLNLKKDIAFVRFREQKRYGIYFAANGLLIFLLMVTANFIQYTLFSGNHLPGAYRMGYFARFGLSAVLIAIIIRIMLLLRESKQKDKDHEQLKSAYLEAQLELLKEQLNPHLLFNSLSSLSGIVREDPTLAQFYIFHLSKVFRHALARSGTALVTVAAEMETLRSYVQLLNMRFEEAFRLETDVEQPYLEAMIPHLSLQPLLENAAKHNSATLENPLIVRIYTMEEQLIVSNNLQEIAVPESSTGIGLVNLNERFRLLVKSEIEIERSNEIFTVKLPLTR